MIIMFSLMAFLPNKALNFPDGSFLPELADSQLNLGLYLHVLPHSLENPTELKYLSFIIVLYARTSPRPCIHLLLDPRSKANQLVQANQSVKAN